MEVGEERCPLPVVHRRALRQAAICDRNDLDAGSSYRTTISMMSSFFYRSSQPDRQASGDEHLRGLAAVPRERRQAIARLGAQASAACRRAHRWTQAEAQRAAQKGVAVRRARRETVKALITRFLPPAPVPVSSVTTNREEDHA